MSNAVTSATTFSGRPAVIQVREMLLGHLLSRGLCTVAVLGIPDLLAGGPLTSEELARRTGVHAAPLHHLLDALVTFEVFARHEDGSFGLTPLSDSLRSEAEATSLPTALLAAGEIGQAWQHLPAAVQTGRPAFDAVFGIDFFNYLDRKPELRDLFDRSQGADLVMELERILDGLDLSEARLLIDVGGGDGTLLAAALRSRPRLRGELFELPSMTERARSNLAAAGVGDRGTVTPGDFFAEVPPGGDVYVLREILHDWDDEQCLTILRACRRAMPAGARLAVVEMAAGQQSADEPAGNEAARLTALMTLYMMAVVPGRERTLAETTDLLRAAGFTVRAVHRIAGQKCLVEAIASEV